jgi:Tfp pilus assembly protein PilV
MKVSKQNSIEVGRCTTESGMSLIETTIALVIIMVALLGVVHSFTYAVTYNAGNTVRSEALAILQREVEAMRAAKWTSSGIAPEVVGTGPTCDPVVTTFTSPSNGGVFEIQRTVDDDPFTDGCQVDTGTQLKEITLTVRPSLALAKRTEDAEQSWWFAVPSTIVLRRTRGN